jgi:cytochrome c
MKYYYLNKIAMAVLVALLLFFGTRTLINIATEEHAPEKPGFEVAGTEKPHGEDGEAGKPGGGAEIIAALQSADPAQGENDVGLCKVCHSFDKGGPTMIGPNLYGVVGHKIASHEGVNYTPALKEHGDQEWTFENLDVWLKNPQAFAPGTSMAFPGIPDLKKRANVIAYLNKNSDSPLPLPEPKAEEAAADDAGEAPADEAAAGQPEVLGLMATADPAKGEAGAALCKVCHTVDKGGATLIGPNLWGVVGHDIAAHEGFSYTAALKGKDGEWTYEQLDAWLTNPQAFAPGTTMAFPGIPDAKKRADVIAYLRTLSDDPVPLPEAAAAPAEEPAAEEPAAEEPAADEEPAAEEPAAEEPAAEEAPAAEEPAAEEPAAEEPAAEEPAADEAPAAEEPEAEEPAAEEPAAEEPAAEEPAAEAPAAEEPEAVMEEETVDETIVVQPTVSEDAPSEPSMGEPASESQPQPVYPDGGETDEMDDSADSSEPMAPSDSDDGLSSQPQPVYPDGGAGEMDDSADSSDSMAPSGGDDGLSSQPQPAYPDGPPDGL